MCPPLSEGPIHEMKKLLTWVEIRFSLPKAAGALPGESNGSVSGGGLVLPAELIEYASIVYLTPFCSPVMAYSRVSDGMRSLVVQLLMLLYPGWSDRM